MDYKIFLGKGRVNLWVGWGIADKSHKNALWTYGMGVERIAKSVRAG